MAEKKQGAVERLRETLNNSISRCEEPLEIILELAEILGEVSNEKTFYGRIRDQISTNYGKVFRDRFAIDNEIKILSERLKRLESSAQSPEFDDDERRRIIFAIERHQQEIARLESLKES